MVYRDESIQIELVDATTYSKYTLIIPFDVFIK